MNNKAADYCVLSGTWSIVFQLWQITLAMFLVGERIFCLVYPSVNPLKISLLSVLILSVFASFSVYTHISIIFSKHNYCVKLEATLWDWQFQRHWILKNAFHSLESVMMNYLHASPKWNVTANWLFCCNRATSVSHELKCL